MPTLTIPDVSPEVLTRLAERAAAAGRTVEEEALRLIAGPVVPVPPGPERPAPTDIPEVFLSPEIPAPFDLDPPGPSVPVAVRDIGPIQLEFWFDEDKGVR